MTNNTPIYWEANGLSLHTYAWSVKSFGGSRNAPAPKRGEDLQLPGVRGRRYVKKVRESMQRSLAMWLMPLNQDGSVDATLTFEQMLHKNWRTILDAVDVPGQFALVKRWYDDTGVVKSATGYAEFLEGMEPEVAGGYRHEFTMDLFMADPYFYGSDQTVASLGAMTVLGDVETDRVVLTLNVTGNARVDMSDGNWFTYTGGAGTLTVDSYTGIAKLGTTPVNGLMARNPDFSQYAVLTPGSFTVTATSGISSGSLVYNPAYR